MSRERRQLPLAPPPRTRWLVAPIAALTAISAVGTAASPWLIDRSPLLLITLAPRSMFLVAAANDTPLPLFLLIGVVRLSLADPFHFRLGRLHGSRGIAACSRWSHLGPYVERSRRLLVRGGPAGVVASPTAKMLVVAAAAGADWRRTAIADLAGTIARVVGLYAAGNALSSAPTQVVGVSVAIVALVLLASSSVHRAVTSARAQAGMTSA